MRRLAACVTTVALILAVAPVATAADNHPPVAVDDPATPGCNPDGSLGGTFMIVEDPTPQIPGIDPGWTAVLGACAPLANDSDEDGDPLTALLEGQPAHGEAQWLEGDFLLYKPDPDYSTFRGDEPGGQWISDEVHYRAFDGQATSNVATYRYWIAPVNDPPTFTPGDAVVTAFLGDGEVSVPWATGISPGPANEAQQVVSFEITDLDVTGVPNMFATAPSIDADGVLHFETGSEVGLATVTVRARDDGGLETWGTAPGWMVPPDDASDEVTFSIVVNVDPGNHDPVAVDDSVAIPYGDSVLIDVLANDSDADGDDLTVVDASGAHLGLVQAAAGGVRFSTGSGLTGTDTFGYTVSDGRGGWDTGTVHVTITTNAPPVAADDSRSVPEKLGGVVDVLANDTDPDDDVLTVTSAGGAIHGTTTIVAGGVRYVPAAGYAGPDTFTYVVGDGNGGTDQGTVAVSVAKDSTAPTVTSTTRTLLRQVVPGTVVDVRLGWSASDTWTGVASYQLQERVGDGSWRTVTLPTKLSTSATRAMTIGTTYRYRVRATDVRGNTSAWTTWASITPKRIQQTSSSVRWSGTWSSVRDSRFSGGSARRTSSSGRKAILTFSGRDIGWVTMRSTIGGRAQLRVDGALIATVDVDGARTGFRRMVWTRHLTSGGPHTLEIRPLGDGRVTVDAFIVLP